MDTFLVELRPGKWARDPHPMGPNPPLKPYILKGPAGDEAKLRYEEELAHYHDTASELTQYRIESMVCESGIVVRAEVLDFAPSLGQKRTARLLAPGIIQTIPTPRK